MLKSVGLNKREFSDAIRTPLTTINGWTVSGKENIPAWVEPFLDMMIELNECTTAAALGIKGAALDKEVAEVVEKIEKGLFEKQEEVDKKLSELSKKMNEFIEERDQNL